MGLHFHAILGPRALPGKWFCLISYKPTSPSPTKVSSFDLPLVDVIIFQNLKWFAMSGVLLTVKKLFQKRSNIWKMIASFCLHGVAII
jgi:hypothetical protein